MTRRMKTLNNSKLVSFRVPLDLLDFFSKICREHQVTKTEAVLRYIEFLEAQHHNKKEKLLNAKSHPDTFSLDD